MPDTTFPIVSLEDYAAWVSEKRRGNALYIMKLLSKGSVASAGEGIDRLLALEAAFGTRYAWCNALCVVDRIWEHFVGREREGFSDGSGFMEFVMKDMLGDDYDGFVRRIWG